MEQKNFLEEIRHWEQQPWYGIDQFEEKVTKTSLENQKGLHLHNIFKTHIRMPVKQEMLSGPIWADLIYGHHIEPRVQLFHWTYWRHQDYSYNLKCFACKQHRWLLEHWWVKRFVWFMNRFHTIYLFEGKASRRTHVVRGEIDQTASNIKACSFVARNLEKYVKELLDEGETKLSKWKTKAPRYLSHWPWGFQRDQQKWTEKTRSPSSTCYALEKCKQHEYGATRCGNDDHKSKLKCFLEAEESKRLRMEEDTEMLVQADVAQDSDSERPTRVASNSRKHSNFTHFPKDRNCELSLRTKTTRAPWRRRICEAAPQAEKFGDLMTADHNVLDVEGESRNNHRYAVVVQGLATQWIQSYPCMTKTSQEMEKSVRKFLEPSQRPKVICTDTSLEFGKSCEELSWNHRTLTPHRSETNGFAERAVRRVTARTPAVLLQAGLNEKMVGWFQGMRLRRPGRWGRLPTKVDSENHWRDRSFHVVRWSSTIRFQHEIIRDFTNLARKFYQEHFLDMHWSRVEFGKETLS